MKQANTSGVFVLPPPKHWFYVLKGQLRVGLFGGICCETDRVITTRDEVRAVLRDGGAAISSSVETAVTEEVEDREDNWSPELYDLCREVLRNSTSGFEDEQRTRMWSPSRRRRAAKRWVSQ